MKLLVQTRAPAIPTTPGDSQTRSPSGNVAAKARREASTIEDDAVDRLVFKINAICKGATLDFALTVGRAVVDGIYFGDLNAWRRRVRKNQSFRKLARHPNLPMSPAALYRSVAIFELCERLGITSWKHVSTTHIRSVLRLHADDQRQLLQAAEVNMWSARRLEEEVGGLTNHGPARGGRHRDPFSKTIRRLEQCLDADDGLIGVQDYASRATTESVQSVLYILRRFACACAAAEDRLRRAAPATPTNLPPPSTSSEFVAAESRQTAAPARCIGR
jgi:hypothetical protein